MASSRFGGSRVEPRLVAAAVALSLAATLFAVAWTTTGGGSTGVASPARDAEGPGGRVALPSGAPAAVLREWDRRRAEAWTQGDEGALAALYVPGSRAGKRDVRRLRRWNERGWRLVRLQVQRRSVEVVWSRDVSFAVRVTERVGEALAAPVGTPDSAAMRLPSDAWDGRTVVFRKDTGRWRVASVSPG